MLVITDPQEHAVDPVLQEHIGDFFALIKGDPPHLLICIGTGFTSLDPEIVVRKAVLLTFNYVAHLKPHLVRPHLDTFLPLLYGETKVQWRSCNIAYSSRPRSSPSSSRNTRLDLSSTRWTQELSWYESIDNSPARSHRFTMQRQASFETVYTLLDTCLPSLDLEVMVTHLASPITDTYDIQVWKHRS